MTDFVQAKEFPSRANLFKCYVSSTWIVLERGSLSVPPSTNKITHMKMSCARFIPSLPILRGPRGEALSFLLYFRSGPTAPPHVHVCRQTVTIKFDEHVDAPYPVPGAALRLAVN